MKDIKKWFKCAGIRAIKTMAQTAIALIPAGVTLEEVSWLVVLSTSVLAGILSMLRRIAGLPELKE